MFTVHLSRFRLSVSMPDPLTDDRIHCFSNSFNYASRGCYVRQLDRFRSATVGQITPVHNAVAPLYVFVQSPLDIFLGPYAFYAGESLRSFRPRWVAFCHVSENSFDS